MLVYFMMMIVKREYNERQRQWGYFTCIEKWEYQDDDVLW